MANAIPDGMYAIHLGGREVTIGVRYFMNESRAKTEPKATMKTAVYGGRWPVLSSRARFNLSQSAESEYVS